MILKRIDIELQSYGPDSGKYKGKITFNDGTIETFTFEIKPETCAKYLSLIQQEVLQSANELGEKLAKSFVRELETPKEVKNISDFNK